MQGDKFPMGYSLYGAYECAVIRRVCCYGKTQQACRAFCVASLVSLHSDSLAVCGIATCYLAPKPSTMQVSAGKLEGFFSLLPLQGVWDVINLHDSLLKQRDQRKVSQKAGGLECDLSLLLCAAFLMCRLATSLAGGEMGLLELYSCAKVIQGQLWLSLCPGKGALAWTAQGNPGRTHHDKGKKKNHQQKSHSVY